MLRNVGRGRAPEGLIFRRAEYSVAENAVVRQRHHDPLAVAVEIDVFEDHAPADMKRGLARELRQ